MTGLYRKKPIAVEARQLLGSEDGQTGRDLADWCGGSVGGLFTEPKVLVPTLEGALTARAGDWIVKGPRGEFWPVKGSIFADTYEDADAPLHAACRTEALTEGAALIEDRACDADWNRPADYCAGLRAGAELLLAKTVATAPTSAAALDFFRPGHTYANANGFRFECHAAAPTPWDGTLRAIGYLTHPDGSGHVHGLTAEQWHSGAWNDTTDATRKDTRP